MPDTQIGQLDWGGVTIGEFLSSYWKYLHRRVTNKLMTQESAQIFYNYLSRNIIENYNLAKASGRTDIPTFETDATGNIMLASLQSSTVLISAIIQNPQEQITDYETITAPLVYQKYGESLARTDPAESKRYIKLGTELQNEAISDELLTRKEVAKGRTREQYAKALQGTLEYELGRQNKAELERLQREQEATEAERKQRQLEIEGYYATGAGQMFQKQPNVPTEATAPTQRYIPPTEYNIADLGRAMRVPSQLQSLVSAARNEWWNTLQRWKQMAETPVTGGGWQRHKQSELDILQGDLARWQAFYDTALARGYKPEFKGEQQSPYQQMVTDAPSTIKRLQAQITAEQQRLSRGTTIGESIGGAIATEHRLGDIPAVLGGTKAGTATPFKPTTEQMAELEAKDPLLEFEKETIPARWREEWLKLTPRQRGQYPWMYSPGARWMT